MFSKLTTREGKLLKKNFHKHFSVRTLRTSDGHPADILADVRQTFWRTSNGHSADIRRTFWWTSDGHSGGHLTDILRTSDGHSSGRPHKIPADAEYWNRMSDRFRLCPQNCPTGILADVPSLFLIIFCCLLADVVDIVFQYSAWTSVRCPQGILAEKSCNGGYLGYGKDHVSK